MRKNIKFLKRRVIAGKQYEPGDVLPDNSGLSEYRVNMLKDMFVLIDGEEFDALVEAGRIKSVPKKEVKEPEVVVEVEEPEEAYTKEALEELKMNALRKIGNGFDVKDNDKSELIDKILEAQSK